MSNRKVILMLIPNLNFGGAQRVFYNLSVLLSDKYHIVECVFNLEQGHTYKTANELISLNVKGGNNVLEKTFRFFQRVTQLRKLKRRLNPVMCISHLEGADLVNVFSRGKELVITWVHGSKVHDQNIKGFLGLVRHRLLIPIMYRYADRVITVSKAIQEELIDVYRIPAKRTLTIYNYFNGSEIQEYSKIAIPEGHQGIYSHKPVLVFSGRLARQKNVITLIKWFNSFNQNLSSKLLILGDGEMRNDILELCRQLNLKTHTVWTNEISDTDVQIYFLGYCENPYQYIARSSLFVLPSLWEGFPLSLGEAMFCGVPVAAANCPTGPYEMLTSEGVSHEAGNWGLLLPLLSEDTFEEWTSRIKKLLTDHHAWKRSAKLSVQRAYDFDKSKIQEQIFNLIDCLAS